MPNYEEQLEQHNIAKSEGIRAWVNQIANLVPNSEPDQKILITEGLTALLLGPPSPTFKPFELPLPQADLHLDAEFISPWFEEQVDAETMRVWDWPTIARGCTHAERTSNEVTFYSYQHKLLTITGEAAKNFWEWQKDTRTRSCPALVRFASR